MVNACLTWDGCNSSHLSPANLFPVEAEDRSVAGMSNMGYVYILRELLSVIIAMI